MRGLENISLAQRLLEGLGAGAEPGALAGLFSRDVEFDVAGDIGALPWIGRRIGLSAAADFIRGTRTLTQLQRFEVQGILADETRAVVFGEFISRVTATGRDIESAFALILSIGGGRITRFQMLEDSFAVSRAARP